MSAKRKILDESHPDCAKYNKEFHAIWDAFFELEKRETAKYPDWRGLDHPANSVLTPARRKCCQDTETLQKKYAYLFTVDIEDDDEKES